MLSEEKSTCIREFARQGHDWETNISWWSDGFRGSIIYILYVIAWVDQRTPHAMALLSTKKAMFHTTFREHTSMPKDMHQRNWMAMSNPSQLHLVVLPEVFPFERQAQCMCGSQTHMQSSVWCLSKRHVASWFKTMFALLYFSNRIEFPCSIRSHLFVLAEVEWVVSLFIFNVATMCMSYSGYVPCFLTLVWRASNEQHAGHASEKIDSYLQRGEHALFDLCKDGFENDPWNLLCGVVMRRIG